MFSIVGCWLAGWLLAGWLARWQLAGWLACLLACWLLTPSCPSPLNIILLTRCCFSTSTFLVVVDTFLYVLFVGCVCVSVRVCVKKHVCVAVVSLFVMTLLVCRYGVIKCVGFFYV